VSLLLSGAESGPLAQRLNLFNKQGSNYTTLILREKQWSKSISLMDNSTIFLGNGYALRDLPYKVDIHNGLIASLFHFGAIGMLSQIFFILYFLIRIKCLHPPILKGIMIGCVIIFMIVIMTGPTLSRRSIWMPVLLVAAYLSKPISEDNESPSPVSITGPAEDIR
jgi:hypothetical protein